MQREKPDAKKTTNLLMKQGFKNIAIRMENGERNFLEVLMKLGGITMSEAEKVLSVYRKFKLVKFSITDGVIKVNHGAILDRDVILNAVNFSE